MSAPPSPAGSGGEPPVEPATAPTQPATRPSPGRLSRRRFLTHAGAGSAALLATGAAPQPAQAATFIEHSFDGLAAFTVPGNDRFSRHQRVSAPGPGGVDAMAGRLLKETFDQAIPLTVSDAGELPAPGALGIAMLLESLALHINPLAVFGPFASPFANLTWLQKRAVLQQLENQPVLQHASINYATGAVTTLAALGAYSEYHVFDRRAGQLRGRPLGWIWSNYGGVSDGWDEFIGYHQGRTEVTG